MYKYTCRYIINMLIFNTNKNIKNKYFDIKYSILSGRMI